MPIVRIEKAGNHSFDMAHLRRQGAEELVESLLEKVGVFPGTVWRVRVNEKQQCSSLTPPISVVRYCAWGVYLRIKPGDNNTCHNVTLILPSGIQASKLFALLKSAEKDFNQSWGRELASVEA